MRMIYPHAQQGAVWRSLDTVRHFFVWLFVETPLGLFHAWQSTAANFESEIAVVATLKNITQPLFQDYTREGRIIGILLRFVRVIIGALLQVIILGLFIVLLALWLILPFYIIYQLAHNILGIFTPT